MSSKEVKEQLQKLYNALLPEAKKKLEANGFLAPIIFGITPTDRVIAVATKEGASWDYSGIDEMLRRRYDAIGMLLFDDRRFLKSKKVRQNFRPNRSAPQDIPTGKRAIRALLVTFGWSEEYVLLFHQEGKKIVWEGEPVKLEGQLKSNPFPAFEKGIH